MLTHPVGNSSARRPTESGKASSIAYCERLAEVYLDLAPDSLVAPLPAWTTEDPDSCLHLSARLPNHKPEGNTLAAELENIPRLQAALAAITAYTPAKWLLEQELSSRETGASANATTGIKPPPAAPATGATTETPNRSWYQRPFGTPGYEDVYDAAAREQLFGLALSGGGIRSATFSLGILQALAAAGLLEKLTYLSTVSGGGYIHQWLASWIHNEAGGFPRVNQRLIPIPEDGSQARAPEQISWLRRYSSYLTPRRGLFSADTWTMITIWARNTSLNQIVLFGFLGSCIWAIRGITLPFTGPDSYQWLPNLSLILLSLVVVLPATPLWLALRSVTAKPAGGGKAPFGSLGDAGVICWLVVPGFVYACLLTLNALGKVTYPRLPYFWAAYLLALLLAVTFGGQALDMFKKLRKAGCFRQFCAVIGLLVSAAVCGALSFKAGGYLAEGSDSHPMLHLQPLASKAAGFLNHHLSVPAPRSLRPEAILTTFAPVLFFFLQFVAFRLQLGIIGRFYTESRREWLARFGAWSAILSVGWMSLCLLALIGPAIFHWFFSGSTQKMIWSVLAISLVHAVTLSSGASSKTDGNPKAGAFFGYSALDLLGIVGAPFCLISLLIIVSGCVDIVAFALNNDVISCLFAALLTVATFVIFGWRVDVNVFSMHSFYRDRLARCYLGGTNPLRTPDPFTGFDDHEEISTGLQLDDLLPAKFQRPRTTSVPGTAPPPPVYTGPFPIFCSTINLTFGEDLAAQERKGASFAFTPLYSGYHVGWTAAKGKDEATTFNGFVLTEDYAYRKRGIGLSAVTAISGAALSPNQGFSSQPALAFLMTLFNVRLNWWIANPRKPKVWPKDKNAPTPVFGLAYLLRELFGLASDTSNYVCLCDGGRFEDMGMYELVRRRCRLIVVCDGEQENGDYQGIGGAISKCRTDFGAEIDLDLQPLIPNPTTGRSAEHFRLGTIRYPAPPSGNPSDPKYTGYVIYLKTTYVGDEPGDILHHKKDDPAFPQDSTLNQWFTESDFESYRRLGQLTGKQASSVIHTCAAALLTGASITVPPPTPPTPPPVSVVITP